MAGGRPMKPCSKKVRERRLWMRSIGISFPKQLHLGLDRPMTNLAFKVMMNEHFRHEKKAGVNLVASPNGNLRAKGASGSMSS